MSDERSRLVYSTDRPVPAKDKAAAKVTASDTRTSGGRLRIRVERKGRAGKTVTVIEGLRLGEEERARLLRQLKARLGTGGTIKEGAIEIQGDHRDAITGFLRDMGVEPLPRSGK